MPAAAPLRARGLQVSRGPHVVLDSVDLTVADDAVEISATVRTTDRTGVEMEALTAVAVDFAFEDDGVRVTARASLTGRTGVEMEALTAASLALLTVYDMAKALDKGMVIDGVRLLEKTGGKSGDWRAQ